MIDYEEDSVLTQVLFRREGSVVFRSAVYALGASCVTVLLLIFEVYGDADYRKDAGILDLTEGRIWSAATATMGILLGFRTKQALGRFWEGTSLLHQMRGEWYDSVSCLFTFSRGAKKEKETDVEEFRNVLVRLMSFCHGSALEEIRDDPEATYDVVDIAGLDLQCLEYLRDCHEEYKFNRVEVILHMIQVLVTNALDDGVLKIPPPILSRVYQTLSRGFVNLLNCKKITDTRFPFPYTQLMTIFLIAHIILTPLLISTVISNIYFAAVFTFIPVFGMFSLNFIAQELEMPFGDDANDLPLSLFQEEMNQSLMMLLHPQSDRLAKTSSICKRKFHEVNSGIQAARQSQMASTLSEKDRWSNSKALRDPEFFLSVREASDKQKTPLFTDLEQEKDAPKITPPAAQTAKEEEPKTMVLPSPTAKSLPSPTAKSDDSHRPDVNSMITKTMDEFIKANVSLMKGLQDFEKSHRQWVTATDNQMSSLLSQLDGGKAGESIERPRDAFSKVQLLDPPNSGRLKDAFSKDSYSRVQIADNPNSGRSKDAHSSSASPQQKFHLADTRTPPPKQVGSCLQDCNTRRGEP